MSQTKKRSLFEVCCNTFSGMFVAYLCWEYIVIPWTQMYSIDLNDMAWYMVWIVNGVFTVVSVIRGYLWRRCFNRYD
jgi:TRAP-type C4-dicarboxylate transport system permease small subunit